MGSFTEASPRSTPRDVWRIVIIWVSTRLVTYIAAAVGSMALLQTSDDPVVDYVELWNRWDSRWFESIATEGYVGSYVSPFEDFQYNVAFFPGVPMLMRLGMAFGLSATATGMIVSFIAGLVAAFALSRLTTMLGGRGIFGAVAWIVAPTAVFLSAAYTEALFAAFAFWAWVFARQGRWLGTGVLAAAACLVRPNGIFLTIALVAMFVLSRPTTSRNWLRGLWLGLPVASVLGYFGYLQSVTGSWTAWNDAQRDYWDRHLVDPFTSLRNTYDLIWTFSPTGEPSSRMVTEILAMAILIITAVLLARRRMWPESTYVGLTMLSLGTSSMYHSVPRTLVVVFPIWMLLGVWLTRHRTLRWAYFPASLLVLIVVTIRFTQNQWIS